MSPAPLVIAIDGPAGSGKSTIARMVARALGIAHLDTGAMYRAVTAAAQAAGADPADEAAVTAVAAGLDLRFSPHGLLVDGEPADGRIRTPAVDRAVSIVAAHPAIRRLMVARQRELLARGDAVAEGRDIGTVVYPDAPVKVFLTASIAERARRRLGDLEGAGHPTDLAALEADIAERDRLDSSRAVSPLKPAEDAVVLDTTGKTPAEVVAEVVAMVRALPEGSRA
ncbi:MAG TPA: (d)CMP kinase [Actinomycetota bacterium]